MTDEQFSQLMNRMKKKDVSALKNIYEAYSGYVYHIVLSIVGQKEDAEDIASAVFVALFEKAEQFNEGGSHKGYLATIARNKAYDFMKKQSRVIVDDELLEDATDETEDDILRKYLDGLNFETEAQLETSDQDLWEELKKRAEKAAE